MLKAQQRGGAIVAHFDSPSDEKIDIETVAFPIQEIDVRVESDDRAQVPQKLKRPTPARTPHLSGKFQKILIDVKESKEVKNEPDVKRPPGRQTNGQPEMPEEVALLLNFSTQGKIQRNDHKSPSTSNEQLSRSPQSLPTIPAQGPLIAPVPKILRRVPPIQPDQIKLAKKEAHAKMDPVYQLQEIDVIETYMDEAEVPVGDEVVVFADDLGGHDYTFIHSAPFNVRTIRQRACLTSPITALHVEREKKFGRKTKISSNGEEKPRPKRGRPPRYALPPDTPVEEESKVREKETQRRARVAKKNRLLNQREVVDKVYGKVTMLLTDQRFDWETRQRLEGIKNGLYHILAERDKKSHHEIAAHLYKDYLRSEAGVIRRPGPLPKHMLPELANVTDPKERQRLRNCAAQRRYREATNAQEMMYNEVVHNNVAPLLTLKHQLADDLAAGIEEIVNDLCSATKKKELDVLKQNLPIREQQFIDVGTNSD